MTATEPQAFSTRVNMGTILQYGGIGLGRHGLDRLD